MSERRDFFKSTAVTAVDRFVPEELLALFFDRSKKSAVPIQRSRSHTTRSLLVSTGDPINNSGALFGGPVSSLLYMGTPDRGHLVFGHQSSEAFLNSGGLTVVEFMNGQAIWSSPHTKRWTSQDEVPEISEPIAENQKISVATKVAPPLSDVKKLIPTPWNSILVFSRGRGFYELALDTNSLKFCGHFAKFELTSFIFSAQNGKALKVYFRDSSGRDYRYISHQFFDSRILNHNHRLLTCGRVEEVEPIAELEQAGIEENAGGKAPLELATEQFFITTDFSEKTMNGHDKAKITRVWMHRTPA